MNKKYKLQRIEYYSKLAVKHELLKAMKDREVIFMDRRDSWKCIRGLWIKSIEYLNKFFDVFDFFETDYNIYISVSKYKFIPPFTFNLKYRSEQTSNFFKTEAKDQIYNYTYLFDFDSRYREKINNKYEWIHDRNEMIKEVLKLCVFLSTSKQFKTFDVIPSGNNFQVQTQNYRHTKAEAVKKHILEIKERLNLKFLDKSGLGHDFKIMKCPYSFVGNVVCLPLFQVSEKLLNDYSAFESENVLKTVNIYKRGMNLLW